MDGEIECNCFVMGHANNKPWVAQRPFSYPWYVCSLGHMNTFLQVCIHEHARVLSVLPKENSADTVCHLPSAILARQRSARPNSSWSVRELPLARLFASTAAICRHSCSALPIRQASSGIPCPMEGRQKHQYLFGIGAKLEENGNLFKLSRGTNNASYNARSMGVARWMPQTQA